MISQKQVEANRRNALESTGPKSREGKARVARNALRHGLLSEDVLMEGERHSELNAFRAAIVAELAPEGEVERLLADRAVASAWRLRRANRLERDVVEQVLDRQRALHRSGGPYADALQLTARQAAAHTLHKTDTYSKLSRYEAHIERSLYRALHELERRQAARRGQEVTLPLAVDIDVSGGPLPEAPVTIHAPAPASDDA